MGLKPNPIVLALDVGSAEEAVRLARRVVGQVGGFKVGLGLLHGPGPGTIRALTELGKPVFADAKLHDIPSQVETAAKRLGRWGARWVTAHAGGGPSMLEAAVNGLAAGAGGAAGILGVTVLTSLDGADLTAVGIAATPGKLVAKMARAVAASGAEGIVCSPQELGVVAEVAPDLVRMIPGIRPEGTPSGDQARVATPQEAMARGATWLVIGRAITAAPDPEAAAAAIVASLDRAH